MHTLPIDQQPREETASNLIVWQCSTDTLPNQQDRGGLDHPQGRLPDLSMCRHKLLCSVFTEHVQTKQLCALCLLSMCRPNSCVLCVHWACANQQLESVYTNWHTLEHSQTITGSLISIFHIWHHLLQGGLQVIQVILTSTEE